MGKDRRRGLRELCRQKEQEGQRVRESLEIRREGRRVM